MTHEVLEDTKVNKTTSDFREMKVWQYVVKHCTYKKLKAGGAKKNHDIEKGKGAGMELK